MSSFLLWGEGVLVVLLLFLVALCSMGETIIVVVNRGRLRATLRTAPYPLAQSVWRLLASRETLSSFLMGTTVCILLASALTTHIVERIYPGWGEIVGIGLASFIVIFCEVFPKSLSVARSEDLLIRFHRLFHALAALFRPLNRIVYVIARWTMHRFGADPDRRPTLTHEEVLVLLREAVEAKTIEPEEFLLARRILELDEILVRDIMVPLPDLIALPVNCTLDEVMETVIQTGHSRVPLYDGGLDNIVGVVYAYDILARLADGERAFTPREIARPPYFVPETQPVRELLQTMRTNQVQIAIVLDEHGATAGLVTLEDIVEEIVGELRDEHDREAEPLVALNDRTWLVDARVDRRQFEELTGIPLPEGEFNTVGGFIFTELGRLPFPGEKVATQHALFIVEEVRRQRITRVRVIRRPREAEEKSQVGRTIKPLPPKRKR